MSEPTTESRAEQLRRELAEAEAAERAERERQRQAAELERRKTLAPELAAEAEQWEQEANEQLEREFPPAWQPHKQGSDHPSQLVGQVTNINPRVGPSPQYGTYSAAIEMRTTQLDEWTIWAPEGGALYSQLVRLRIQPGDMVAVRYRGLKQSTQSQYSFHDYKLVRLGADKAPSFVDYDQLSRDREQLALPAPEAGEAEPDDGIPF